MEEEKMPFLLLEGEKVVQALRPQPNFKSYLFLQAFLPFLGLYIAITIGSLSLGLDIISSIFNPAFYFLILGTVIGIVIPALRYPRERYWITNQRLAINKGATSNMYKVEFIPLERISDIVIKQNFIGKMVGLKSLNIKSLSGQRGRRYGAEMGVFTEEGHFEGLPHPEETQELIFKLVKENRKEEKLTF